MNIATKALTLIAALTLFTTNLYAAGTQSPGDQQLKTEEALMLERALNGSERDRQIAAATFLNTIDFYYLTKDTRGHYEDNLKSRLKAINSIWALGELGSPKIMPELLKFYIEADDVIKMNLIISIGKLENRSKAIPYLLDIAAKTQESEAVRSLAFEILDHIGHRGPLPEPKRSENKGIEKADLLYTGGLTGTISGWFSPDLPVGHAGVFIGTEVRNGRLVPVISDCVPDRFKPYGGVRNIYKWSYFLHHYKYAYYGNRTTAVKPTAAQRDAIAKLGLEMGKKGLPYSDTHLSQKGPTDFDCVGWTEFLYESVGLDITDNKLETGWGWPLTPWEQFIAAKPNTQKPGNIIVPNNQIIVPNNQIIFPGQSIITQGASALNSAFGMNVLPVQPDNTAVYFQAVN